MQHPDWAKAMKVAITAHRAGLSADAIVQVDRVIRASRSALKSSLSDWHFEQALGLKSIILEESGQPARAARLLLLIARKHEVQAGYHESGMLNSLAAAALCHIQAGNAKRATKLGRQVMKLSAESGERNAVIDRVAAYLEREPSGA